MAMELSTMLPYVVVSEAGATEALQTVARFAAAFGNAVAAFAVHVLTGKRYSFLPTNRRSGRSAALGKGFGPNKLFGRDPTLVPWLYI